MESIGHKLRSTRESLNLTIDQVATETNIAKHHLVALEDETYDELPGETYILGFLRNYSDYLGLDPNKIISLYRNIKIQEEPTPIEDLLDIKKKKIKPLHIVIIISLVLVLAAAMVFYVYPKYMSNLFEEENQKQEKTQKAKAPENTLEELDMKNAFVFSDEVIEKRFNKNEIISVIYKEKPYPVIISDISDVVTFSCPQGDITMSEGSEKLVDLDGNSTADIRIFLRTFDSEQESLILHIDRFVQDEAPLYEEAPALEEEETIAPSQSAEIPASSNKDGTVLKRSIKAEPFTLNITFRGYCFFRYETNTGERKEKYFHKDEVLRLSVNSSVTLWASNAGTLSAKVDGIDVNLGAIGEVATKVLKWNRSINNSGYELQLININ